MKVNRSGGVRRATALALLIVHIGAQAGNQACDPALDEAIEKRRQQSDQQIDTVDQDISNSGKRMLECMVDFAEVVGNSINIGGRTIDLSGVVKSLNQEACRMTREAKQGRLPRFPSWESVARNPGGQLPGRTPPVYTPPTFPSGGSTQPPLGSVSHPPSNNVPMSYRSNQSMDGVYDALSNAMGGRR
ncbi:MULTISPECIES: hypothetical protein [Achromobacter]|uniref:hypothetical protein n=1 Tax=Achromobacter TaxID=222 RepID=UPI0005364D33|nr:MULTISPECIES: hypothetical protein [Achromobacter]